MAMVSRERIWALCMRDGLDFPASSVDESSGSPGLILCLLLRCCKMRRCVIYITHHTSRSQTLQHYSNLQVLNSIIFRTTWLMLLLGHFCSGCAYYYFAFTHLRLTKISCCAMASAAALCMIVEQCQGLIYRRWFCVQR